MKRFDRIRNKYNIPIYTFAEDYALSSAFLLLQMGSFFILLIVSKGDKVYCDETSLVGNVGTKIT